MTKRINLDSALSDEVDVSKVRLVQRRVDANSDVINGIVDSLVAKYCDALDDYMKFIRDVLQDDERPPTDVELDDFTLNIPVLLYFTGEAQEALGIKEDVAKAVRQELYSESYENATGTVGDKTAAAELATQAELVTHIAYQRAYKKVKLRMEAASETLQSVKKVVSRRMSEHEITRTGPVRMGGI